MLRLTFLSCGVCDRLIDAATVMDDDEVRQSIWCHPLPPRRYRRQIAPELCDHCWFDYRSAMLRYRWGRSGRGSTPPFRQIYLWQWVASRLAEKGGGRLRPHFATKADRGLEAMTR
ncbi:hypothetical protein [Roseomonas indoligenes]|uniref:Uncharacterized protein n=1 Tax=Roseomonas indoligenes TaxID=2820811 RepID=A0A940S4Q1_9PROT|nr:hypothetical protein [Pararoseomonas indoligenes]MBP0492190.1 hypothetical protein [Pararoseomonas indoligenes]